MIPPSPVTTWEAVLDGRLWVSNSFELEGRRHLLVATRGEPPLGRRLSGREAAVTRAIQSGRANKVVAFDLGLSVSAVGAYLNAALKKLRLASRAELIAFARAPMVKGAAGDCLILTHRPVAIEPRVAERLSATEAEVAELAACGLSNADIARVRGRAERTVANQLAGLFAKLGIGSRAELASLAYGVP